MKIVIKSSSIMAVLRTVLLAVALSIIVEGSPSARIIGGTPVDTFRRFPHHVTIRTITFSGNIRNCSGSILSPQWILSSIGCVSGGSEYRLDFNRLYLNRTEGSFSVLIDNSTVTYYPTEYDDLALIRLPLNLEYSSSVKSIDLFGNDDTLGNQFAVMPGFGEKDDRLTYGMFQITSNENCEKTFGDGFDQFTQICTTGWKNNQNVPCAGNEGGGLIVGWPRNPKLIGVFSTPLNCSTQSPAIYMKISKYIDWIQSVIGVSRD